MMLQLEQSIEDMPNNRNLHSDSVTMKNLLPIDVQH